MNYAESLKHPKWQEKRLRIMERDNFTCRDTGKTDEQLQVHHCWYAKGPPWNTPDEYLLTLCESAHKERQALEQRAKKALGMIMAQAGNIDGVWSPAQELSELVDTLEYCAEFCSDGKIIAICKSDLHSQFIHGLEKQDVCVATPEYRRVEGCVPDANKELIRWPEKL